MSNNNIGFEPPTLKNKNLKAMHPAVLAAQQFRQDIERDDNQSVTQNQQDPAPVVQSPTPVTPPVSAVSVQSPASTQQDSVEYVPVTNIQLPNDYADFMYTPPSTQQSVAPVQQPAAPTETEAYKNLQRELDETRNELKKFQSQSYMSPEMQALREQQAIDEMLKTIDFEYSSVNEDDAKKLIKPIVSTMYKQNQDIQTSFKKQLEETQSRLDNTVNMLQESKLQEQYNATRKKILEKHPDLEKFQKTEAYAKAMMSPVDNAAGLLVGQLLSAEFRRGNADYVIGVLDKIKGTMPNFESIASVSPSGVGMTAAAVQDEVDGTLTDDEVADLKFAMQSGKISRTEFRTKMNKHREAASKDFSRKSN